MRWPTEGRDAGALQAYLGHCNIQHTVRYTELSPARFKNFRLNSLMRMSEEAGKFERLWGFPDREWRNV